MGQAIYRITPTDEEILVLEDILACGKHTAQKRKRVQAMLHAHCGMTDKENAASCGMHERSIQEIRKHFVEHGFELTLNGIPKKPRSKTIGVADEARLIALACETTPDGHRHWALRVLQNKFLSLESVHVDSVSHETIRKTLKKMNTSPGKERRWHRTHTSQEYISYPLTTRDEMHLNKQLHWETGYMLRLVKSCMPS